MGTIRLSNELLEHFEITDYKQANPSGQKIVFIVTIHGVKLDVCAEIEMEKSYLLNLIKSFKVNGVNPKLFLNNLSFQNLIKN
jgi:hypothetical protein